MRVAPAFLFFAIGATPLWAQRADPVAVELANLREDVRMLQQNLGELRLTVEQLQRENGELARQAETGKAAFVTLAQLNEALAIVHQATEAALASQKNETVQLLGEKIGVLAKQTQAAIDAVAKGQAARPAITTQFNDDFPKQGLTHTVQTGETLSTLAKKYGVPMKDIQNANRLADPTKIRVGQTLFIPGATAPLMPAPQIKP